MKSDPGATLTPRPICDPTVIATFASESASELCSRRTCDSAMLPRKFPSMSLLASSRIGRKCSVLTFHRPLTWFTTRVESPLTARLRMPSSAALRKPPTSAMYSASLLVLSSPRYSAISKTTRESASRRMSAPAPAGPGFPRLAPSKYRVYVPSVSGADGAAAAASSSVRVGSFPLPPDGPSAAAVTRAEVDISRAPAIELAPRGALGLPGDVGGLRRVEGSGRAALGRASSPTRFGTEIISGFFSETHRAASSLVEKDLCTAPLIPSTCARASSHVVYTPGVRPCATP